MGIKSLFKHLLLTTAVLSIYACGGGGESSHKTETIIEVQKQRSTNLVFADQNLTDCVQALIDSEGYTLVEEIKQLTCSDKEIVDIEGIQNLSSLELLNLSNNQIRDITPISKLSKLKQLYLQGNNLQLLSPITENQLLEQVDISDNGAVICSEQTKLEQSIGEGNLTANQPCIEGMQQAQDVTFEDANLQACIRQTAQDIGAQHLEQIQQLKCVNQDINNIDGIEQLSNLRELDLTQNNISDITPLQGLALLKKVLLGKNQISNTQPLTTSKYMQELRLDYNQLTDIQYVQTLDALRQIHLTNNQIRDLTPLQSLTGLLELRISNNRIIDIDSLTNLPKLSSLWIQGNQIADLTPLENLQNLEQLWLSNNWLTDLTPLQTQSKLKWLHLDGTEATDLQPLNKLTQLKWLQLDNTRVDDISAIYPLAQLDWLHLKGNDTIPCSQLDQMEEILTAEKIDRPETCSQPQEQRGTVISAIEFQDQALKDCIYDAAREQGVASADELTTLSCPEADITDITELTQFPGITSIDLTGNDHISCAQLEQLQERIGEDALTRPEQCNMPPTVAAQNEQTVTTGTQVDLNAEATDPNGDSLTYNWQQTAGQSVQLTNPNTATPNFTAPQGEDQTITFQLTVTDQYGLSTTQAINILVTGAILGSKDNPFLVTSYADLKKVGTGIDGWNLDSHYLQTADIDATPSKTENQIPDTEEEYYGFEPIGNEEAPFTGGYDGGGFEIDGLTINRPRHGYIGLFGILDSGVIQNIGLINVEILSASGNAAGGLVGINAAGTILHSYVNGSIVTIDFVYVGGLVGFNSQGIVLDSYADTDMLHEISGGATLSSFVGGLVGLSDGEIRKCFAEGDVALDSGQEYLQLNSVGGLIGFNSGIISNSHALGNVSGKSSVGGLIGVHAERIIGAGGDHDSVWCQERENISNSVVIKESYATGNVKAENSAGGLVGLMCSLIEDSYARGSVTANSQVGGLVGQMRSSESDGQNPVTYSSITNSYSTGQVQLQNEDLEPVDFGGLVGASTSELNTVTNAFWDIETSGIETSAGGEPKTSKELKATTTFTNAGWDFDETWMILSEGYTYPRLAWNTIEVESWTDLSNMRNNMHANYIQTRDLLTTDADYAELAGPDANDGKGWEPVGIGGLKAFMGTFDGGGFTIDGLTINRPEENYVGLFGYALNSSYTNINIKNASIKAFGRIGGVVGNAVNTIEPLLIENSSFSGEITATESEGLYCGGIAGKIMGPLVAVIDNKSTGVINCSHFNGGVIGDLVSYNDAYIKNTSFDGEIIGEYSIGGVVGNFSSVETLVVDGSFSSGEISSPGGEGFGGLFGNLYRVNNVDVKNSYSSMNIYSPSRVTMAGGLIGFVNNTPEYLNIENSFSTGSVIVGPDSGYIGGFVGFNISSFSYVNESYATGDVTVSGSGSFIGGVFGFYQSGPGTISNVYSTGNVDAADGQYIGGISGQLNGSIRNSYHYGDVAGASSVGGLIGQISGHINDSYSTGVVEGDTDVGGLVGGFSGEIFNSYATSNVFGNKNVGGLVGNMISASNIYDSYAQGVVSGNSQVGGLLGLMNHREGVGDNPSSYGDITNSYSTGLIQLLNQDLDPIDFGGLVGASTSELNAILNSFWDVETSGQEISAGGIGLMTYDMQNQYTFESAGWDYYSIWGQEQNQYPHHIELDESEFIEFESGSYSGTFTWDCYYEEDNGSTSITFDLTEANGFITGTASYSGGTAKISLGNFDKYTGAFSLRIPETKATVANIFHGYFDPDNPSEKISGSTIEGATGGYGCTGTVSLY